MAVPSAWLVPLLLLAAARAQGPEAGVPGCYLHPINVTVRSDRQGTCRGSHVAHACVGYCESSAFPSRHSVLAASGFQHNITSVSQCCTISRLQKVGSAGLGRRRAGAGAGGRLRRCQLRPALPLCPGEGGTAVLGQPAGAAGDLHGARLSVRHVPPVPLLKGPGAPQPCPGPGGAPINRAALQFLSLFNPPPRVGRGSRA
uniref:Glycoprotein hormone subunit alpha 2 n=1 Tax=Monodelphis domestica TaxID=13616 RepID=A0A5F8GII7_MONDO